MEEEHKMQLPKGKYEVNVNTGIQIVGFLLLIAGGGATWGITRSDIDTHSRALAAHEVRLTAVEAEQRKISSLDFRVGLQEQGSANMNRSVEELKSAVSEQGADLRVIREILTRLEQQIASASRSPTARP